MIDLIVKVSIVVFTLVVGGCFAVWPEKVSDRFVKWRGRSIDSAQDRGLNTRKLAAVLSLRQMGVLLIVLTCYVIYLWARTGTIE